MFFVIDSDKWESIDKSFVEVADIVKDSAFTWNEMAYRSSPCDNKSRSYQDLDRSSGQSTYYSNLSNTSQQQLQKTILLEQRWLERLSSFLDKSFFGRGSFSPYPQGK